MVCSHYYYHHQSQQTTIFPETAQVSCFRELFTPQQLLHFYATVIRPVLEYCTPVWHYAITRLQTEHLGLYKSVLFTLFILLLGACHILIYCSLLSLPPLNPGVTNFQGHSFKTSVTHPLLSIIYFPLHVIHLSCLSSEQPHGLHVLSHAPKILFLYQLCLKSLPGTTP